MFKIEPGFRAGRFGESVLIRKFIVTVLVIIACFDSVQIGRYFLPKVNLALAQAKYRDRSRGNPGADLWVIEYLDFQCEICRDSAKMMEDYFSAHPKEMYWQIRHYPLIRNHLYALKSAIYCECAARQKKFWEFSEKIFQTRDEWAASKDPDAIFQRVAGRVGLESNALETCIKDPSVKAMVLAEREEGKSLRLGMTPTFFVNGERIQGVPAMKHELESYFAKKAQNGKK